MRFIWFRSADRYVLNIACPLHNHLFLANFDIGCRLPQAPPSEYSKHNGETLLREEGGLFVWSDSSCCRQFQYSCFDSISTPQRKSNAGIRACHMGGIENKP